MKPLAARQVHLDFHTSEHITGIGARAPIYITLGWSANDVHQHPGWTVRLRDGTPFAFNIDPNAKPADRRPDFSWTFLCPGTPYRDLVLAQTEEICRRFAVDGLFYDICVWPACWCPASSSAPTPRFRTRATPPGC
jgi:hypothetical protein